MIIEYDERGEITHIRFDPVPNGVKEMLDDMGISYIELRAQPVFGPKLNLDTLLPELDENGEVIQEQVALEEPTVTIDRHYVDVSTGSVAERPVFDVPAEIEIQADGVTDHVIAENLPDGCIARIDGQEMAVEDGSIVVCADMPAEYVIELVCWPYVNAKIRVKADAIGS